jgi:hypothetical protein
MPLTPEIVQALRKPFDPELIKWKIQTNPKEGQDKAIVVAFIDSRDVTERLDLATGGDWSSEFSLPQVNAGAQFSLECALTVCGVTRRDVGTVPAPRQNEDSTKDLYSDALKRAAVQFGVGSHVYRFPKVKAKVQASGKSFYLTFRAVDELLMLNRQLIQGGKPNKYIDIEVRGSSYGAGGIEYPENESHEGNLAPLRDKIKVKIKGMFADKLLSRNEAVEWANNADQKNTEKDLQAMLVELDSIQTEEVPA